MAMILDDDVSYCIADVKRRKVESGGNGKVSIIIVKRTRLALAPD